MNTKQTQNLIVLQEDFISQSEEYLKNVIRNGETVKAKRLADLAGSVIEKYREELKKHPEKMKIFQKTVVKCQFVALPLLSDTEVKNLLKNYFTWQFRLQNYNFLEKFRQKLVNIELEEDRDKLKKEVKAILEKNENVITSQHDNKTISDWIKHYNTRFGTGKISNLQKNQYMTDLRGDENLEFADFNKLQLLFDFYEMLKYSSFEAQ